MAVIHVTEAEAARDLPALLARVREGADVQIESGPALIKLTVATTENSPRPRFTQPRLLSDILADLKSGTVTTPEADKPRNLAEALRTARAQNSNLLLDDQFGNDLEEVMRLNRQEGFVDPWERS